MLHNLTLGHMDTTRVAERGSRVLKPLDRRFVDRHLAALGEWDGEAWRIGGSRVEFRDGCVVVPWLGSRTNRAAEEFALRLARDTGCQIIDREHGRVVEPGRLVGLPAGRPRPILAGARRVLKALGM